MAQRWIWLRGVLAMIAASPWTQACASPTQYALDPDHTVVTFEVRRLGFSRQSGEFGAVAGTVALDVEAGNGSIAIAVDTRSVRAGSEAQESFLRGPSVLNVEQYAEIAYKADRVVFVDGKPDRIDGHLTLLGVTRAVSLRVLKYSCPGIASAGPHQCKLDATAVFKRSEFGMTRYMALVSDEVTLAIHGVADHAE
jgi:polyisoprenoid-binding protein YceI